MGSGSKMPQMTSPSAGANTRRTIAARRVSDAVRRVGVDTAPAAGSPAAGRLSSPTSLRVSANARIARFSRSVTSAQIASGKVRGQVTPAGRIPAMQAMSASEYERALRIDRPPRIRIMPAGSARSKLTVDMVIGASAVGPAIFPPMIDKTTIKKAEQETPTATIPPTIRPIPGARSGSSSGLRAGVAASCGLTLRTYSVRITRNKRP